MLMTSYRACKLHDNYQVSFPKENKKSICIKLAYFISRQTRIYRGEKNHITSLQLSYPRSNKVDIPETSKKIIN